MDKPKQYHKVISCSGITDPDLPSLPKCPFYNERYIECSLDRDIYDNPMTIPITTIPETCPLRKFNIVVYTEVLNQAKLEM